MRQVVRFCLVILCFAALSGLPAFGARGQRGAHRRVLGVVSQTDRGHIDTTNAVTGADIYSCDSLTTDDGGTLRVRVGAGQIYLSSASAAALEDDGNEIQVVTSSGTIGFSEPTSGDLSIRTPAGIVRAAGGMAVAGEVTYKGPMELMISAMRGDLTLDVGGELRTIPEGKSADVTFDDNFGQGCHDEGDAVQQQQHPVVRHPIGFYIVAAAAVGVPSYILWQEWSESDSKPHK
jgi:hypothetical protein